MMGAARQIVGQTCVRCGGSLLAVVDGRFCHRCQCPVHSQCATPNPADAQACPVCGAEAAAQSRHQALSVKADEAVKRERADAENWFIMSIVIRAVSGVILIGLGFFLGPCFTFTLIGVGLSLIGSCFVRKLANGRRVLITHRYDD